MAGDEIIWQNYNPYPKGQQFITPQWVFIDRGSGAEAPFNDEEPISSNLQQVLFIFPGAWQKRDDTNVEFVELASTGNLTGTIRYDDIMMASRQMSPVGGGNLGNLEIATEQRYVLAAHVRGKLPPSEDLLSENFDDELEETDPTDADNPEDDAFDENVEVDADEDTKFADDDTDVDESEESSGAQSEKEDKDPEINVVLVADIDCLASAFFHVRAQGQIEEAEISWNFDNVTFVLNSLDVLAGDERFVDVRKRRRAHRTLMKVEDRTEEARKNAAQQREKFVSEFNKALADERGKLDRRVEEIKKDADADPRMAAWQEQMASIDGQRKLDIRKVQLEQQRDRDVKKIERDLSLEIRRVQDRYKMFAVLIPPIPPLLVAFFVFFHRRQRESQGVAKSRLR